MSWHATTPNRSAILHNDLMYIQCWYRGDYQSHEDFVVLMTTTHEYWVTKNGNDSSADNTGPYECLETAQVVCRLMNSAKG